MCYFHTEIFTIHVVLLKVVWRGASYSLGPSSPRPTEVISTHPCDPHGFPLPQQLCRARLGPFPLDLLGDKFKSKSNIELIIYTHTQKYKRKRWMTSLYSLYKCYSISCSLIEFAHTNCHRKIWYVPMNGFF